MWTMTLFAFDYLSVSSVRYATLLSVNQARSKRACSVADTRLVVFSPGSTVPVCGNNAATGCIFCLTYFVIKVVNKHLPFLILFV